MAILLEGSDWVDGIYRLETDDPVLGGEEGIDNLQAKQLASRTQFLKNAVEQRITNEDAAALIEPKAPWTALDPVIEAGGLIPDHAVPTQLRDAIKNIVNGPADKIVRVASTAAINLAAPGANIDGTAMVVGDTILEKDNATLADRGVYVWNGAAVPATRDPSADNGAELFGGMIIRVKEGAVNADTNWQITNDGLVTIGVTGLTFQKIGGAVDATETTKGIAEIATQAETDAGTDDARFVTPLKMKFGFAYSFTPNGFIKFPSWLGGLIGQWGIVTTAGGTVTITLPLNFPNQIYTAVASFGTAGAPQNPPQVELTSTSTITITNYANGSTTKRWIAIGN